MSAQGDRLRLGPIEGVATDDYGVVLNFWQPILDSDGNVVGRSNTETLAGWKRRRAHLYDDRLTDAQLLAHGYVPGDRPAHLDGQEVGRG